MRKKSLAMFFLVPGMLAFAGSGNGGSNGNSNKKNRTQGTSVGSYTLKLAGQYAGSGSASVSTSAISITATIKMGGAQGTLVVDGISIVQSHFIGTGTIMGAPCTIEGRVDLPAATDDEQTDKQASTGRISATVRDAKGKMVKLVGIQTGTTIAGNG